MDAKKLHRIAAAAAAVGLAKQTLDSAVRRGDVPSYPTACGLPLVRLADVKRWAKNRPNRRSAAAD